MKIQLNQQFRIVVIVIIGVVVVVEHKNYYSMSEKVKVITLRNEETGAEDQYALNLKPLGEGKTAKVYKATSWPDQTKLFAVKVIKLSSEEVRKDYLKELKIIKSLPDCPNVVKTHKQHFESENNLYIFQEYCQTGTLATFKAERLGAHFSQEQIYDIFFQVSNGMIFLLDAGIIHEDIKPANILKRGSFFKLCDFGVSEISKDYVETTTRRGTISYMPPEKLKTKHFMPSDRSDMYSLGITLYEIIFGIHPYLSKKTVNYKEYLVSLSGATLKPLPTLMKRIGSTSLKLESVFKFLERMIDLNAKTRVTLSQLKQFLFLTDPFKDMKIMSEEEPSFSNVQNLASVNENAVQAMFQSVITYKQDTHENSLPILKPQVDPSIAIQEKITARYHKESPYVVGVISLLLSSIDLFRKTNFCNLNIRPLQKNFLGIDLSSCRISRFIKYLIYEFAITTLKHFRSRYQNYLDEPLQEKLMENERFLEREFNKFLIECDFLNKEQMAEALQNKQNNLQLWIQVISFYEECINSLTVIEQNRQKTLLCYLYCIYIPKIVDLFTKMKTLFSKTPLEELEKLPDLEDTSFEEGELLLEEMNDIQKYKKESLQLLVQQKLSIMSKQYIFDIGEDSEEIEVITQEQIEMI